MKVEKMENKLRSEWFKYKVENEVLKRLLDEKERQLEDLKEAVRKQHDPRTSN